MGERAIAEFKGPDGDVEAFLNCQFGMPDRKMPATEALIKVAVCRLERPFTMAMLAKSVAQLAEEVDSRGSYAAWEEIRSQPIDWNAIEFVYTVAFRDEDTIEITVRLGPDGEAHWRPYLNAWTHLVTIGKEITSEHGN